MHDNAYSIRTSAIPSLQKEDTSFNVPNRKTTGLWKQFMSCHSVVYRPLPRNVLVYQHEMLHATWVMKSSRFRIIKKRCHQSFKNSESQLRGRSYKQECDWGIASERDGKLATYTGFLSALLCFNYTTCGRYYTLSVTKVTDKYPTFSN